MDGIFINMKHYDFQDNTGKQISGTNMNCLVDGDIFKVSLTDDQADFLVAKGIKFGMTVPLDVRVKGRFAKYILHK